MFSSTDPIPPLLASESDALRYLVNRDLTGSYPGKVEDLWNLPAVRRSAEHQQANGSWKYHGGNKNIRSSENYDQIETYRVLRELVEKYTMTKANPILANAADFLFSHQTDEGDFRGIIGSQYALHYSAAMMELLIKGGYSEDPRIERGFEWLISVRQSDGGWAFPARTVGMKLDLDMFRSATVQPDKSKPSSHLMTGMALRAFAASPKYRNSKEARKAGELLASRFFKSDAYPDRSAPSFWTSFSFPFWFTDLLSALDSLSLIGFDFKDPKISKGLSWFATKQTRSGLWKPTLRIMAREKEPYSWISLAIYRVFKRFYEPNP